MNKTYPLSIPSLRDILLTDGSLLAVLGITIRIVRDKQVGRK